jgi:hypothetical protein
MSLSNPLHHNQAQTINIRPTNQSVRLLKIPPGASCSRCDSFRLNPSRCIIKHKEVKSYNRCEFFKEIRE